ncbi:proprotein convertase P-domain-containing protein [Aquimarina brevivitae]|uniref:Putative secreted protein (Por secretion system target) n=1 Tax=Aquimarina brevivitae TaxID=323412 RepID=A0A4Q7PGY0_9FLAO|nr:proprotein convertase P-domain-containing protein [Aquimarina brevivitae]RZS99397.1 putative secreted protein (Por secretion system target) [Aquimarina brevivitae]
MLKKLNLISVLVLLLGISTYGQVNETIKPNRIEQSSSLRIVQPLNSKSQLIPAKKSAGEIKDARSSRNKVVIGKGSTGDDKLSKNPNKLNQKVPGTPPSLVFDTAESNSQPTDPSLAVGRTQVIAVFNTGFKVFDKNGNALTGDLSPDNLFSPGSCCDLTISYDHTVDRWVMSILYGTDGHVEVAVSQGPDAVNDAWSVYSFDNVNDYQKLSVWSDGYYMTANVNSGSAGTSDVIFVMDRTAMLAGEPTATLVTFPLPGISTNGFYSPQAFNVSNGDMPALGNAPIVYMQDDAWSGVADDHIKIWTVDVDFANPGNSTISQPTELVTTDFVSVFDGGSFSNLPQPNGGSLVDALQATIMNQAQFRKFDNHNSALFNFVVDTDGSNAKVAGIRWIELRQSADGQPWTIFQEGTYNATDGKNAWNASLIMDGDGNIGMGYTGMGGTTDTFVSSYYTGRFADDPLGTMTIDETLIATGNGNIPGTRYGDYSKIDIDPLTDSKFWYVTEYVNAANNRANVAGVFQLKSDLANDVAPVALDIEAEGIFTNSEDITITVYNLGTSPVSNFDVSYQINGGAMVTETITSSIAPNQSVDFTFAQTADLSAEGQDFAISVITNLTGDERIENNTYTTLVKTLFSKEIGVTDIIAPVSGQNLGAEQVTIAITNFGGEAQSNFDVSYSLNGGSLIIETFTGTLNPGATQNYTFTQTADFSTAGTYEVVATSLLEGDSRADNDAFTKSISNFTCTEFENTTAVAIVDNTTVTSIIDSNLDEIVEDIIVRVNIEHTFNQDLIIKLIAPDNQEVILSNRNGSSSDNFQNTIFSDSAADPIASGTGPFIGTFRPDTPLSDLTGLSTLGQWTLSVQDNAGADTGQIVDWSISFCTAPPLSTGENLDPNSDLIIVYKENNQFEIRFESESISSQLDMDVFNLSGQRLLNYRLDKEGKGYFYNLDMSYAASGVYLVRLKDKQNRSKVKRLIVK